MHTRRTFAAAIFVIACVIAAFSQPPAKVEKHPEVSSTERSIREFFDSYAEDLRSHKREAIADRYDRRGVYLVGNGSKAFMPFEQLKDRYLTKWSGPKSFKWKDLSVDVISKNTAVVTGLFEWQDQDGTTFNYSYTGLLIKQEGKWRIRLEDESTEPSKAGN
ncbi:MAG: DUF4440 domain-containing protein [Chloracidobacterium sp.]|nr:DUF4440 domain-containing protein [Chloracidobacterium sp.]